MRYGIHIPNYRALAEPAIMLEGAQRAEELGYDSIWVSDHIVIGEPHIRVFGDRFYEPFTLLAYLAARTSRVRLGISCVILPYRSPLEVAKMVADLDVLSNGRVVLGAAGGWMPEEFQALGLSMAERGARCDEYLLIIKELWTKDKPSFSGKFYSFSDIIFYPKPVQKPHPPILLGGNNPRALRRAVELADGWHPTNLTLDEMETRMAYLKELAAKKGRVLDRFEFVLRCRPQFTDQPQDSSRRPLRGTIEEVIQDVRRAKALGITELILDILVSSPQEMWSTMERFAREVVPAAS